MGKKKETFILLVSIYKFVKSVQKSEKAGLICKIQAERIFCRLFVKL